MGFLILLVLANSLLNLETRRTKSQLERVVNFRILTSSIDNFNTHRYSVWHDNQVWEAEFGSKVLNVGSSYQAQAKLENLIFDTTDAQFANYDLSLGISGKMKILEILAEKKCDLECLFWRQINSVRRSWQTLYRQTTCDIFGKINNFFSGNQCENVFGLTNGLVLGGTDKFDKEMRQNFRTLGLSHLVAVSGFQVVLLVSFLEQILRKIGLSKKTQFLGSFVAIAFLILMVGPQPPVIRSGISLLLAQSVLLFLGKKIGSLRCLIFSALIMLIFNPFYIISVSFQLSFLASFGLILGLQSENVASLFFQNSQSFTPKILKVSNNSSKEQKTENQTQLTTQNTAGNLVQKRFQNNVQSIFPNPTRNPTEEDNFGETKLENSTSNSINNSNHNQQITTFLNQKVETQKAEISGNSNSQKLVNSEQVGTEQNPINSLTFNDYFDLYLTKFLSFFGELFWASFNSFLFTLPIIINISGQVSLLSIPVNLLIVPIIPILTIFNLAGLLPFLGVFPIFIASFVQSLLILLINDLANLKLVWTISSFSLWEMLAYYVVLVSIFRAIKLYKTRKQE